MLQLLSSFVLKKNQSYIHKHTYIAMQPYDHAYTTMRTEMRRHMSHLLVVVVFTVVVTEFVVVVAA